MADFSPLEVNKKLNARVEEEHAMEGLHERIAPLIHGTDILDIGCGSGHFSRLLPQKRFTHIDCVERKGLNNIVLDVSTAPLPFSDASFDTVLLVEILEHLENPWHAVREAKRVGKSIIISTPVVDDLRNKLIYFFHGRFFFFFNKEDDHIQPIFRKQLTWMRGDWVCAQEVVHTDGSGGKILVQHWVNPAHKSL